MLLADVNKASLRADAGYKTILCRNTAQTVLT